MGSIPFPQKARSPAFSALDWLAGHGSHGRSVYSFITPCHIATTYKILYVYVYSSDIITETKRTLMEEDERRKQESDQARRKTSKYSPHTYDLHSFKAGSEISIHLETAGGNEKWRIQNNTEMNILR